MAKSLLNTLLGKKIDSSAPHIVTSIYRTFLKREPDQGGLKHYVSRLERGASLDEILADFLRSEEFVRSYLPDLGDRYGHDTDDTVINLLQSNRRLDAIHELRCQLVRTMLPGGDTVIDLGGASSSDARGALISMGYPHRPKQLYIIDLPPEQRVASAVPRKDLVVAKTMIFENTQINYVYQSMGDLSNFKENSIDFVWSGESIEHVPIEVANSVFETVFKVLRPGGIFALDTPNRHLTRIQVGEGNFIHFEHFTEYFYEDLVQKALDQGFRVKRAHGLIEMPRTVQEKKFLSQEFLANAAINDNPRDSYIFFLELEKPAH